MDAKHLSLLLAFLIVLVSCSCVHSRQLSTPTTMVERHEEWMAKYGRVYSSEAEKQKRLEVFAKNVKYVEDFNAAGGRSYKLAINHLADYTSEEVQQRFMGYDPKLTGKMKFRTQFRYANTTDVPESLDWREEGAVTEVKNQQQCGSCWAFAVVGAVEGYNKIKTGELVSLSEQELLDCSSNNGCKGGDPDVALNFVRQYGLTTEQMYPYYGSQSDCDSQTFENSSAVVRIGGYENMPISEGEEGLLKAVSQEPVVVGVNVGDGFTNYGGGIFDGTAEDGGCSTKSNHVVVAVGYGTDELGNKFWILKNSWGETWGENGYMRMRKDTGNGGVCGVAASIVAYPTD